MEVRKKSRFSKKIISRIRKNDLFISVSYRHEKNTYTDLLAWHEIQSFGNFPIIEISLLTTAGNFVKKFKSIAAQKIIQSLSNYNEKKHQIPGR